MTQLDILAATIAQENGMRRASMAVSQEWKDQALEAVRTIAGKQATLTCEDLWGVLVKPGQPKALGPIIKKAAGLKWIRATSNFVKSRSGTRHRAPIVIWESLLFKP